MVRSSFQSTKSNARRAEIYLKNLSWPTARKSRNKTLNDFLNDFLSLFFATPKESVNFVPKNRKKWKDSSSYKLYGTQERLSDFAS